MSEHDKYLTQLILNYQPSINVFSEELINVTVELSDEFLRKSFKIEFLKDYFDEEAWVLVLVLDIYKTKLKT